LLQFLRHPVLAGVVSHGVPKLVGRDARNSLIHPATLLLHLLLSFGQPQDEAPELVNPLIEAFMARHPLQSSAASS
jgi:hypothetical protein